MSDDTYNGWTNRETWAVALHINNDQGWQESVLDALREYVAACQMGDVSTWPASAGDIIRENVESVLFDYEDMGLLAPTESAMLAIRDIGSLWRVNWTELGASFLSDLDEV